MRRHPRSATAALAAGVLAGANLWTASGYLGPLRTENPPDFIFQARPLYELIAWCAAGLLGAHALGRVARRRVDFSPSLLLVLPLAAIGLLATPIRPYAGPWLLLFIDMRWWFLCGVVLLQLLAFDEPAQRWRTRAVRLWTKLAVRPSAPIWADAALAAALALGAIAFAPPGRFQSAVTGDEPKYLRFMENWYRGHGLAVGDLPRINELPPGNHADVTGNLRRLASAVPVVAADLLADGRRAMVLSAPAHAGPATSQGGWFVEGKRGGIYQVHHPGVSALLFPGYYVDRHFLNWAAVPSQFPPDLYATGLLMIAIYALWGVAVFRLVAAHTAKPALAWLLALVAMLSMPVSAFSYQFYPEAAAGLALTLALHWVVFSTDTRLWTAIAYGLLIGYLPWLHLRFGLAAVAAAGACTFTRRQSPRTVAGVWMGLGAALAALGVYYYHIDGSPFPWALYAAVKDHQGFDARRMLYGLTRFLYDWRGGVIAHAPVFLLALPGLVLCWRRRPQLGVPLTAVVLLVAGLAAAHDWRGAGSTPGRMVAAVAPLLAVPIAEAVLRYGRSRVFVALFALLSAVSVANGMAYNMNFDRLDQAMYARTVGGWMTPLLLPTRGDVSGFDDRLLVVWWTLTLGLVAMPWVSWRRRERRPVIAASWPAAALVALGGFALAGTAAALYNGRPLEQRFMADDAVVRRKVIEAHLAHPQALTWSAQRGVETPARLFPNTAAMEIDVEVLGGFAIAGEPMAVRVDLRSGDEQVPWTPGTIDFGDATGVRRIGIVGSTMAHHTFAGPGRFAIRVDAEPPGSAAIRRSVLIDVMPPRGALDADASEDRAGLPPSLLAQPAALIVEAVAVKDSQVELRCVSRSPARVSQDDMLWVWIIGGLGRPGRLLTVRPTAIAEDGRRFTLAYTAHPPPPDLDVVRIVAGLPSAAGRGRAVRTRVVRLLWPGPPLTRVGAVVLASAELR